jgi:PEP-CTERM motif
LNETRLIPWKGAVMNPNSRNWLRAGLAMSLVLGFGLGPGPAVVNPTTARAARVASNVQLNLASSTAGKGTPSPGARLALLASEVAARRSSTLSSTSSTTTSPAVPTSVPQLGPMIPTSVTDSITNSKLLKDFEQLIALKSGKLVNWNQQTLNALESDMGITSPRHVAPHLATTKPALAAQVLDGSPGGSGAAVQPAPVPEPATLLIFATALGGLALRSRFVRPAATN